jgi:MFS family permease
MFASVPLTNGGGIIADTVKQEERGFALAIYTMGTLLGPVVGPVAGGLLAAEKGWRWIFWVITMAVSLQTKDDASEVLKHNLDWVSDMPWPHRLA